MADEQADGMEAVLAGGILSSAQRRRRGKGKKAGPPVFDDHVQRVFRADAPNRLWLADITEHWTAWIPAIVATPESRSWDAGAEVHAAATV